MLVENQEVEIVVVGKTINHYKVLGYAPKAFSAMTVRAEDLSKGSHGKVKIICDYCGKEFEKVYKQYLGQKGAVNKDACLACKGKKTRESMLLQCGVENVFQLPENKEKQRNTIRKKYGVDNVLQSPEVKERVRAVFLQRYGVENPMQIDAVKDRAKATSFEKYGVTSYTQTKEYNGKAKATCIERYGYEHSLQSEEVRKKIIQSMCSNDGVPTSSQQKKIYGMLKTMFDCVKINEPVGRCICDIAIYIDGVSINVEYDGWYWHQDQKKDRRRDEFLKSLGWKVLRIKSARKIPTQQQLVEAIDKLLHTDRFYAQIVLDDWREPTNELSHCANL